MENTFEITVTYYPSDNIRESILSRKVVSLLEFYEDSESVQRTFRKAFSEVNNAINHTKK